MLDRNPITLSYNVFKGNRDLLRAYWDLHKNAGLLGLVLGIAISYFRAPHADAALKTILVLMSGVGLVAIVAQALEHVFIPFFEDAIKILYGDVLPSTDGEIRYTNLSTELGKTKLWKFRSMSIPIGSKSITLLVVASMFLFGIALFVVTIAMATSLEMIRKIPMSH